jgi:hypothetical protein
VVDKKKIQERNMRREGVESVMKDYKNTKFDWSCRLCKRHASQKLLTIYLRNRLGLRASERGVYVTKGDYRNRPAAPVIEQVLEELFGSEHLEWIHSTTRDIVNWIMFDYWVSEEEL